MRLRSEAMSVAWNTYEQLSNPCVQYGTSSSNLTQEACSTNSITYTTSRTWANSVTLTGLAPATTYYYKIVSTNSTVEQFLSPRKAGDTTPFSMSIVVDLGVYGTDGYTESSKRAATPAVEPQLAHATIGRLADNFNNYELVLHPGDYAYADDWSLNSDDLSSGTNAYASILENFFDQLAPIAGGKPYMVAPGNHEANCKEESSTLCPTGQKNFTDFRNRFGLTMPTSFTSSSSNDTAITNAAKAKQLSNPPFWYSFEYGSAHIVMFNTETDFTSAPDAPGGSGGLNVGPFGTSGQQLAFLQADLASVDRTVTPWVIVAGHRTWYSTGGSANICSPCKTAFESTLYKYGVDLVIFGHIHNSQRFKPVYNGVADAKGMNDPAAPMYIVAGGAGNIEGLVAIGANVSYNAFAYATDYSYATVSILDANHLQVEFVQSSTGDILDSSVLYKSHSKQFVVQS